MPHHYNPKNPSELVYAQNTEAPYVVELASATYAPNQQIAGTISK